MDGNRTSDSPLQSSGWEPVCPELVPPLLHSSCVIDLFESVNCCLSFLLAFEDENARERNIRNLLNMVKFRRIFIVVVVEFSHKFRGKLTENSGGSEFDGFLCTADQTLLLGRHITEEDR